MVVFWGLDVPIIELILVIVGSLFLVLLIVIWKLSRVENEEEEIIEDIQQGVAVKGRAKGPSVIVRETTVPKESFWKRFAKKQTTEREVKNERLKMLKEKKDSWFKDWMRHNKIDALEERLQWFNDQKKKEDLEKKKAELEKRKGPIEARIALAKREYERKKQILLSQISWSEFKKRFQKREAKKDEHKISFLQKRVLKEKSNIHKRHLDKQRKKDIKQQKKEMREEYLKKKNSWWEKHKNKAKRHK